jgi:drug/metabolite transporter (DMT)-like permease
VIGLVLALLAGFSFAVSSIFIRGGVHRSGESYSPVPISLFLGTILFGLALFILGEAEQLVSLSWLAVSTLAGAGIINFLIGRMAAYTSIRLIGANRAVPLFRTSILIAALLGIFFLREPLTLSLVLALLLIVGGITLISTSGGAEREKSSVPRGSLTKGVLAALLAALCWGVAPALISIGLREVDSPLVATFVSYISASAIIGASLFSPGNTEKLRRLSRSAWLIFVIAGAAGAVAQLFRYSALNYSPVSLVAPLAGTDSLFVLPLSFLINRKIEAFNLRIILGTVAVVAGVFLIFWGT